MKYFVTGATGFIGGRLVRQLVDAGHEVVTIARNPTRAVDLVDLGVKVYPGDITERETLRAPMQGADGVFHVAGWYKLGERDISPGYRINVDGTRNVLETMRQLEIPRGVYTSTLAVFSDTHGRVVDESYRYDGPHLTEYDRTKWTAHYDVAEPAMRDGLPLIVVLPGAVYGPGDTSTAHTTFAEYVRGRLLAVPARTAYCWAHVDDTARGHILAMERGTPGEDYIIAGPVHSVIEVLDVAQRITGRRAPRIHVPPAVMRWSAQLMRPLYRALPLPSTYSPDSLRSAAGVTYIGSNAKARRELGYVPRSLEEGLPETLAYEVRAAGY